MCLSDHYLRAGKVEPQDIFRQMGETVVLFGKKVSLRSVRYYVYAQKGMKCVSCGIEGHYFAVERNKLMGPGKVDPDKYHLNLYHATNDGGEIMMTVDHILPASLGGKKILENLQPMCVNCNMKKGNTI